MFWLTLGIIVFIVASVVLVLIVLAQRPQGGGLASAFGGAGGGGTDTAFGGRTGDVLTVSTIAAFVIYLLIAVGLNILDNTLIAQSEEEIEAAASNEDAPVPDEALETVPLDALPGVSVAPANESAISPAPPKGSDENDLPGQE